MKNLVTTLVLLVLLLLAVVPIQAAGNAETCVQSVPWGGADPLVQPMGFPFYCCRCTTCVNPIAFYRYTKCNCGYFDGCSGGYPSCNRPYHIVIGRSCDCP